MLSGVVLAAGTSSRMGTTKQLLPLRGKPLLQHAIDCAHPGDLGELIVVLGHAAEEIREAVTLPEHGRFVLNPDYRSGQASSLRAGLQATSPDSRAALVLLGDQPDIPNDTIRSVVELYERTGGPVIRAQYGDDPGHPVVLDRSVWDQVMREGGDRGAGPVLDRHPEWVVRAPIMGGRPSEVDTPEDFRELDGR